MAYLESDELKNLTPASAVQSWLALMTDWSLIAANFALAIWLPHPAIWALCFVMAARHQLALAILMHEGSHRRLFSTVRWNDILCQLLCAAPLFFSMYSYQKLHIKHHREPLAADDPDLSLIGGYPIPGPSLTRKLLRDAFGISYFKFIRYFIYMARRKPATQEGSERSKRSLSQEHGGRKLPLGAVITMMIGVNSLLFTALWLSGHAWLYLGLWLLPMMTGLQVLLRIRGIAEHAGYQPGPDQRLNARTVVNPWQAFFLAPHNVNYHIEHHLYPAIPFFNLPKVHKLLKARGHLPDANVYTGYRQVLQELIQPVGTVGSSG
jgi:fatty acid desaturase